MLNAYKPAKLNVPIDDDHPLSPTSAVTRQMKEVALSGSPPFIPSDSPSNSDNVNSPVDLNLDLDDEQLEGGSPLLSRALFGASPMGNESRQMKGAQGLKQAKALNTSSQQGEKERLPLSELSSNAMANRGQPLAIRLSPSPSKPALTKPVHPVLDTDFPSLEDLDPSPNLHSSLLKGGMNFLNSLSPLRSNTRSHAPTGRQREKSKEKDKDSKERIGPRGSFSPLAALRSKSETALNLMSPVRHWLTRANGSPDRPVEKQDKSPNDSPTAKVRRVLKHDLRIDTTASERPGASSKMHTAPSPSPGARPGARQNLFGGGNGSLMGSDAITLDHPFDRQSPPKHGRNSPPGGSDTNAYNPGGPTKKIRSGSMANSPAMDTRPMANRIATMDTSSLTMASIMASSPVMAASPSNLSIERGMASRIDRMDTISIANSLSSMDMDTSEDGVMPAVQGGFMTRGVSEPRQQYISLPHVADSPRVLALSSHSLPSVARRGRSLPDSLNQPTIQDCLQFNNQSSMNRSLTSSSSSSSSSSGRQDGEECFTGGGTEIYHLPHRNATPREHASISPLLLPHAATLPVVEMFQASSLHENMQRHAEEASLPRHTRPPLSRALTQPMNTTTSYSPPPSILPPVVKGDSNPIKRVSCATIAAVLRGEYADRLDRVYILDCRYDYEYKGGHIIGAIHMSTREQLDQFFDEKQQEVSPTHRLGIVFHCEFSKHRGPSASRIFRVMDRELNETSYPYLSFPEVVILEGGYRQFFKEHPELCEPKAYVSMWDPRMAQECKNRHKEHKRSWGNSKGPVAGYGLKSRSRLSHSNVRSRGAHRRGSFSRNIPRSAASSPGHTPMDMGFNGYERDELTLTEPQSARDLDRLRLERESCASPSSRNPFTSGLVHINVDNDFDMISRAPETCPAVPNEQLDFMFDFQPPPHVPATRRLTRPSSSKSLASMLLLASPTSSSHSLSSSSSASSEHPQRCGSPNNGSFLSSLSSPQRRSPGRHSAPSIPAQSMGMKINTESPSFTKSASSSDLKNLDIGVDSSTASSQSREQRVRERLVYGQGGAGFPPNVGQLRAQRLTSTSRSHHELPSLPNRKLPPRHQKARARARSPPATMPSSMPTSHEASPNFCRCGGQQQRARSDADEAAFIIRSPRVCVNCVRNADTDRFFPNGNGLGGAVTGNPIGPSRMGMGQLSNGHAGNGMGSNGSGTPRERLAVNVRNSPSRVSGQLSPLGEHSHRQPARRASLHENMANMASPRELQQQQSAKQQQQQAGPPSQTSNGNTSHLRKANSGGSEWLSASISDVLLPRGGSGNGQSRFGSNGAGPKPAVRAGPRGHLFASASSPGRSLRQLALPMQMQQQLAAAGDENRPDHLNNIGHISRGKLVPQHRRSRSGSDSSSFSLPADSPPESPSLSLASSPSALAKSVGADGSLVLLQSSQQPTSSFGQQQHILLSRTGTIDYTLASRLQNPAIID